MEQKTNEQMTRRVYIQAFGARSCSACGRNTHGKLCDHITGSCGTYLDNCVPLCSRCHKRLAEASAETQSPETLVCDQCGKGYQACAGVWRLPDRDGDRHVIPFPDRGGVK